MNMSVVNLAMELGKLKMVSSKDPGEHAKSKHAFNKGFLMVESAAKMCGANVLYLDGNGNKHKNVHDTSTPYKTIVVAKGNPEKVFAGHIDVVKGGEGQFDPKIEGNKLIMRGACDMLGPVAALVSAFTMHTSNNVWLVLSDSEEIGQVPGGIVTFVDLYINLLKQYAKFVFDPDSGNGNIVLAQKALKWLKLYITGKSAHGSTPHKGINANLLALLQFQKIAKALTGNPNGLVSYEEDKNADSINQEGITCNLGKIEGGDQVNRVAGAAEMELDIRFWPQHADLVASVLSAPQIILPQTKIELISSTNPWKMPPNHPTIMHLASLMTNLGMPAGYELGLGSSDAALFTSICPILMCRPASGSHHGDNEYVSIDSLLKFEQLMAELMKY